MNLYFKSTTLDKEIGWTWKDMDKAYWDTWIPKKSEFELVTVVDSTIRQEVKDEIWENMQTEIDYIKTIYKIRKSNKREN